MIDCSCNWDTTTEIIQGDVNIDYYQSANAASYICDLVYRRESDDSTPSSAQAVAVYGNIALVVINNGDAVGNTHNMVLTIDLQNQTVIDRYDDLLPAGAHWNSACVYRTPGGIVDILVTGGYQQAIITIATDGGIEYVTTGYTSTASVGGVTLDPDTGTLYGHSGGKFYVMTLASKVFQCDELFDGGTIIRKLTNWIYPGYETHSQECEFHDGVLYSIWSHPNAAFKFSTNGQFLGVDSVPYHSNGHPLGELESIAWSDNYNCYIMLSQGRVMDNYEPGHYLWGRCFLWAWGGAAANNWRVEYSTNDGDPTNINVGGTKMIYATAYQPTARPVVGARLRHDGTINNPFQFAADALYMAASIEKDSSRADAIVVMSGNFAAYEQGTVSGGITVATDVRITLQPGTVLPAMNIANSCAVDFVYDTNTTGTSIASINCSRNSTVSCAVPVGAVTVGDGANFCGNNLGGCVLKINSMALVRLGGTNITLLAGSEKHANGILICPRLDVTHPDGLDVSNVAGVNANNLIMYGV